MQNALSVIESLNLSHDELKHLSERIEDLSRIKKNAFWKQKIYEWYNLKGDFNIFGNVYSTEVYGDSYNFNNNKQSIKFRIDDDELIFTFDCNSHKPIDLYYYSQTFDWRYDVTSKEIIIFPWGSPITRIITNDEDALLTFSEIYYKSNNSEYVGDYVLLLKDINILHDAIFKQ